MPGPSTTAFDIDGMGTVSPGRIRVSMGLKLRVRRVFLLEIERQVGL